jgi:hypothetical protein
MKESYGRFANGVTWLYNTRAGKLSSILVEENIAPKSVAQQERLKEPVENQWDVH